MLPLLLQALVEHAAARRHTSRCAHGPAHHALDCRGITYDMCPGMAMQLDVSWCTSRLLALKKLSRQPRHAR